MPVVKALQLIRMKGSYEHMLLHSCWPVIDVRKSVFWSAYGCSIDVTVMPASVRGIRISLRYVRGAPISLRI